MLDDTQQKELKEVERDKLSGVTVKIKGNNLQRLVGTLEGMQCTGGAGAYRLLDDAIPDDAATQGPRTHHMRVGFLL